MTEDQAKKIIAALEAKGASKPCARCGNENFEILGAMPFPLNEDFTQIKLNTLVIPSIVVGCTKCGNLWTHSLYPLGFSNGLP